jgi:hypothetical protein
MFVVAEHWGSAQVTAAGDSNMDGRWFLHALRLKDGSEIGRVEIKTTRDTSQIAFDPAVQRNRPGLLWLSGNVYVAFATFSCDGGDYHGWVFGFDAKTLAGRGVFCTSINGDTGSGIWQSGNGLVGSDDGFIYFETGNDNGPIGKMAPTLGDSFIRLQVLDDGPWLKLAGQFQPSNYNRLRTGDYTTDASLADETHYQSPAKANADNHPGLFYQIDMGDNTKPHTGDTDLGSGGPILLPGGRLVGGGKQGRLYVLDSSSMTLTQNKGSADLVRVGEGFQAFQNTYRDVAADAADHYAIYAAAEVFGPNIHGGAVYWPQHGLLYQMPEKDYLKAWSYDSDFGILHTTPALTAKVRPPYGMPGGHSSLSANDDKDGIIWTLFPQGDGQWTAQQGTLVAFDALTTLKEIWRDEGHDPDNSEWFAKFNPPTIADGKVFRPCFAQYQIPVDAQMNDTGGAPTDMNGGNGKIVVYGLREGTHIKKIASSSTASAEAAIARVWARHGGSGLLVAKSGDAVAVGDTRGGIRQDFRGHFHPGKRRVSRADAADYASCHRPPRSTVPVTSSLFWSSQTGAHLVTGDIRDEYLRRGGPNGALGYPVADESHSHESGEYVSRFEHGEIVWTTPGGSVVKMR